MFLDVRVSDGGNASRLGQYVERRPPVLTTHEIDDGAHTVRRDLPDPLGNTLPIGEGFRAEPAEEIVVPFRGRGDHAGSAGAGDLDTEGAHAAGAIVDQHSVAGADVQRIEGLQRGQAGQRDGGRFLPGEVGGLARERAHRRGDLLGERSLAHGIHPHVTHHLVTGRELGHRGSRLENDAGNVPARDHREVGR